MPRPTSTRARVSWAWRSVIPVKFVFLLVIVSTICGCYSRRDQTISKLKSVSQSKLIADCISLSKEAKNNYFFELPKEKWPDTIKAINPIAVRNYNGAFAILLHKFVSKEDGIFVTTENYIPENTTNTGYEKIDQNGLLVLGIRINADRTWRCS